MKKDKRIQERVRMTQKQILSVLKSGNKTIAELLGVHRDTVRNRILELKAAQKVRVADWIVLENTMTRVFGLGPERDVPRPVRCRLEKTRPQIPVPALSRPNKVVFRREAFDEWMFRIKGMAA